MIKKKWSITDFNRGHPLPQATKDKISQTKKQQFKDGLLVLPDNRGKKPWNKSVPRSQKDKKAISAAVKLQFEKGRKPWNLKRKWTTEEKIKFIAGAKKMWERRRKDQKEK